MSLEQATALVVRGTDWSETSRVVTLWTREFGRVRALAKGGRRLRSNFEIALDLLTVCRIVFIRKAHGGLDLLTEARVEERFPKLRTDLPAYYGGSYVAELLSDLTEDYDPHPPLFDAALDTLRDLGGLGGLTGPRLLAFELTLLTELGYSPVLRGCAACGRETAAVWFGATAGGVLCPACRTRERDARPLSEAGWTALVRLKDDPTAWRHELPPAVRVELRNHLGMYVSVRLGRRPRLLPYLTG
jgi:DNA repair protein RecO (recombination protein O)